MSDEYRKIAGDGTLWHSCTNCKFWPNKFYVSSIDPPEDGALCKVCLLKRRLRTCETASTRVVTKMDILVTIPLDLFTTLASTHCDRTSREYEFIMGGVLLREKEQVCLIADLDAATEFILWADSRVPGAFDLIKVGPRQN